MVVIQLCRPLLHRMRLHVVWATILLYTFEMNTTATLAAVIRPQHRSNSAIVSYSFGVEFNEIKKYSKNIDDTISVHNVFTII